MAQNNLSGVNPVPSSYFAQNGSVEQNPQVDQQIRGLVSGLLTDANVLAEIQRIKNAVTTFALNSLPVVLHGTVLSWLSDAQLFSYMQVSKISRSVITHQNNSVLLKRVLLYMISARSLKMVKLAERGTDCFKCESFSITCHKYDVETKSYVEYVAPLVTEVARLCQEVVLPLITGGNLIAAKEKLEEIKKNRVPHNLDPMDKQQLVEHFDKSYEKIASAQIEKGDIQGAKETIKAMTSASAKDSVGKVIVAAEIKSRDCEAAMSTIALLISENGRFKYYHELCESLGHNGVARSVSVIAAVNINWKEIGEIRFSINK